MRGIIPPPQYAFMVWCLVKLRYVGRKIPQYILSLDSRTELMGCTYRWQL